MVTSCNNCMDADQGESGDEAREKCPHVIASHVPLNVS